MSQPAVPPSYGAREAQPLSTMQDFAGAQGWDFFAPPDPKAERGSWQENAKERADAAAEAAARLAGTPDGQVLLEFLADVTVRRPMFFVGMPDGLAYAAMREGQNGLFYTLLALVAQGRQERPTVREGT